jgi:DnaJ-domain-containing protein 1
MLYSAGMQFKDMSTETVTGLQYLIESHKIEEVHSAITNTETANESKKSAGKPANEDISVITQEFIDEVEYLYEWHTTMGYYKILDIKEHAANEQIRHAYLNKVNELHPDKFPSASDDLKQKLHAILAYLNAAYSTLRDLEERKKYDQMNTRRTKF